VHNVADLILSCAAKIFSRVKAIDHHSMVVQGHRASEAPAGLTAAPDPRQSSSAPFRGLNGWCNSSLLICRGATSAM
jgi:hypothetical protein